MIVKLFLPEVESIPAENTSVEQPMDHEVKVNNLSNLILMIFYSKHIACS